MAKAYILAENPQKLATLTFEMYTFRDISLTKYGGIGVQSFNESHLGNLTFKLIFEIFF